MLFDFNIKVNEEAILDLLNRKRQEAAATGDTAGAKTPAEKSVKAPDDAMDSRSVARITATWTDMGQIFSFICEQWEFLLTSADGSWMAIWDGQRWFVTPQNPHELLPLLSLRTLEIEDVRSLLLYFSALTVKLLKRHIDQPMILLQAAPTEVPDDVIEEKQRAVWEEIQKMAMSAYPLKLLRDSVIEIAEKVATQVPSLKDHAPMLQLPGSLREGIADKCQWSMLPPGTMKILLEVIQQFNAARGVGPDFQPPAPHS